MPKKIAPINLGDILLMLVPALSIALIVALLWWL